MAAMPGKAMGGGYDLERGIEVDFKDALKKQATAWTSTRCTAKSAEEVGGRDR